MQLIVITLPHFFEGEAEAMCLLFDAGLNVLHLRKPRCNENELLTLLNQIPASFHNRIVLHEPFACINQFRLKGIHLNSRNKNIPEGFTGSISRSCHSLDEIAVNKPSDYVFLSPIFDSISKEGYSSNFTGSELREACRNGIITSRVIGLGGIDENTIPHITEMGFGGVAVLGGIWKNYATTLDKDKLLVRFNNLLKCLNSI